MWTNDKSLKDIHVEVLAAMMKESIQAVENMDIDTKFQKAEIRNKIKDLQISKLVEQINYRDGLIDEARKIMNQADLNAEIADERIMHPDHLIHDNSEVFNNVGSYRGYREKVAA